MAIKITKQATPATPAASVGELFYSTTTPAYVGFIDENATITILGELGTAAGYRFIRTLTLTGSGTYTPTAGTAYLIVEGWGGGGQGGGVANAAVNSGAGGGGGGGACSIYYSATVAASYAYVCGAGGSTTGVGASAGQTGADTTFAAVLTAKGGVGGSGDTIAVIHSVLGGAGGASGSGVGTVLLSGAPGNPGLSLAAAMANSGNGGGGIYGQGAGQGRITQGTGTAATNYAAGGGGGAAVSGGAAVAGGAGGAGVIRLYEYA